MIPPVTAGGLSKKAERISYILDNRLVRGFQLSQMIGFVLKILVQPVQAGVDIVGDSDTSREVPNKSIDSFYIVVC